MSKGDGKHAGGDGSTKRKPYVFGIAGWKNSGKTTMAERLIAELTGRGLRVASVKHAHHAFAIDDGTTDSARHRSAGSQQVAIVSSTRWALVRELGDAPEPSLDEVLAKLDPTDVVIVEGYKRAAIPKLEVRRAATLSKEPLADGDPTVLAIAADHSVETARVPVFHLDDVGAIADFIVAQANS